jgi:hypothetical protein
MARIYPALAVSLALAGAMPAVAHEVPPPPPPAPPGGWYAPAPYGAVPAWQGGYPATQMPAPPPVDPEYQRMLDRCRVNNPDKHVGGTLIGGAVGGLIGNRVASGDRVLGTVAGAAVGAVAGNVIDKAEDKGRDRECEEFFRRYGPPQAAGYPGGYGAGYPGYGGAYPGYAPYGYVMVPVVIQNQQKPCVETTTVTEEWVNVPVRRRAVHHRPVVRDKRVKEKRVYTGS